MWRSKITLNLDLQCPITYIPALYTVNAPKYRSIDVLLYEFFCSNSDRKNRPCLAPLIIALQCSFPGPLS